jgi:hypothetical protein
MVTLAPLDRKDRKETLESLDQLGRNDHWDRQPGPRGPGIANIVFRDSSSSCSKSNSFCSKSVSCAAGEILIGGGFDGDENSRTLYWSVYDNYLSQLLEHIYCQFRSHWHHSYFGFKLGIPSLCYLCTELPVASERLAASI